MTLIDPAIQAAGVAPKTPSARIWAGGPLRDALLEQVKAVVAGLNVTVSIVQVGRDPASDVYIKRKLLACEKVGIAANVVQIDAAAGEGFLHATVADLAKDPAIHGIIVQTPLPSGWDAQTALDCVPVAKDIDGLSMASAGLRRAGDANALLPATPLGVMRLLESMAVDVRGLKVAVVGKGMVGAPLREMLRDAGAEVCGIEKETLNPAQLAAACDVMVVAAGVPGLITKAWVKPGAVVIDVGITRLAGKIAGDVDRASVEPVAGILTPVPGGVGPMTVASLLTNIADAACLQLGRPRTAWAIDATPQA